MMLPQSPPIMNGVELRQRGGAMDTIRNNAAGLGLLFKLNTDRLLYLVTLVLALGAGAWIGAMLTAQ
jgi:hypothetical protein